MACWITFFAYGARRNSSRWDLYSRLGDTGFFRADVMIILLEGLYGNSPCLTRAMAHRTAADTTAIHRTFRIFGTTRFYEQQRAAMSRVGDVVAAKKGWLRKHSHLRSG